MCRGNWELAAYARHHIAHLAAERRACAPIDRNGLVLQLTRLRYSLGIGLIKAGRVLAGDVEVRRRSASSIRPATAEFPPTGR